jgi:Fe-S-cluster containining protein
MEGSMDKVIDHDHSSDLCLDCGLCCTGALFIFAMVKPDELLPLQELGLEPTSADGLPAFRLPCQAHQSGKCSIYEKRPGICRRFKCKLLMQYEKGKVDFEAALSQIHKARQLFDGLKLALELDENQSYWEKSRNFMERSSGDVEFRRQHAGVLLDIVSLSEILNRYFYIMPGVTNGTFQLKKKRDL